MKFFKYVILVVTLLVSVSASAWYSIPKNQADTDQKAYLTSLYAAPGVSYYPWFFAENEQLVRSFTQTSQGTTGYYYYSDNTRIAYSTFYNGNEVKMNYICPKNKTDKVKRHINLMKAYDISVGHVYVTNPACPVPVLPSDPAQQPKPNTNISTITNSTTIAQVQSWYPNYVVTRLYPTRDIFKVECVAGACNPFYPSWDITGYVMYLSDTTLIGRHRENSAQDAWNYVRAVDTTPALTQKAKDDITILSATYFSNYVYWVNDASLPQLIFW